MAREKAVREPTGHDMFPRNGVKAHIYDAARQLLREAEKGELAAITLMYDRDDGESMLFLLAEEPGVHVQNAGIITSRVFATIFANEDHEASDDDGTAKPKAMPS